MTYNLEANLESVSRNDDFAFLTFKNQQTVIAELDPLSNSPSRYKVMHPHIGGMSMFTCHDLTDEGHTVFSQEKWCSLKELVEPYESKHPIVDLERKIHQVHQEMLEPLGLKKVGDRPWGGLAITGALTLTYPVLLPVAIAYTLIAKASTSKPSYDHPPEVALAAAAIMPFAFGSHVMDIIKPSGTKYKITNKKALKKEGAEDTPKVYVCDLQKSKLPRIYFPNGIELLEHYPSKKPNFGSYKTAEYYLDIPQNLQDKLFELVDQREKEKEDLQAFEENLDVQELRKLLTATL